MVDYNGVSDMLLLHKIFISQMFQDYVEIPFYGRYPKVAWKDGRFRIVLADSETWQQTVLEFSDFQSLVRKMDELKPYGYSVRVFDNELPYYYLTAITKAAFKLTNYIVSVKFMAKDNCRGINFVGTWLHVNEKIDDCGSILNCSLVSDGDAQSMGITLYDALCIFPNWHHADSFYLETFISENGHMNSDDFCEFSYVYKVTCSDTAKVEALIAKSKVYRPNLFKEYMVYGGQWG